MSKDYFVHLAGDTNLREDFEAPQGLAMGFLDEVSVRFFQGDKENARNRHIEFVEGGFEVPATLRDTAPDFSRLLSPRWLGLQVDFELLTPWYSKDDRVFHVLDNPVRKDRVFGVPFMAASSWKGMLRWACRMQAGLGEHLERNSGRLDGWKEPDWIIHLFGNERGEEEHFRQGALAFYPTWFNKIDFEVINPHSRARRAGTQPIYYEVVPPGAKGTLYLLYAPWSGMKHTAKPEEVLPELLKAIETLLTTYGISAKRTVGWGTARIETWRAYRKDQAPVEKTSREEFWNAIAPWLDGGTP